MDLLKKTLILKDIIRCRHFGSRLPISAQFAVTNRCPLNCVYCSIQDKGKDEVNTQQAVYIIQQLAKNGNKRLHLVGGEPLLREDLGEIVRAAKSCGLTLTIATSGYKIPQMWEKIKEVDIFFLSFDGPAHLHNMQRGRDSFETLCESIKFLRDRNKKFWTTTVITRQNLKHLDFVLEMAKDKNFLTNFHLLYFSDVFKNHSDSIHPANIKEDLIPDDEEYRKAVDYLLKRKRTDMRNFIGSSELYFQSLLEWDNFSQVYKKERARYYDCMAGRMFCYIDANGDMYPCCDVMGVVKPRNVLEGNFKDAFLGMPKPPCKSCLVACYLELNLIFSLRLKSIFNWAKRV